MTSTAYNRPTEQPAGLGFLEPETAVAERIDQLILTHPNQQHLQQRRRSQAVWLKQAMGHHWTGDLPQPFIGFDLDDGLFIAEWHSDTECNTLTIDAESGKGWYYPWSSGIPDDTSFHELDLNTEEGWQCLRSALTTTLR